MDGNSHRNMAQLFLIAHWRYMIQWISLPAFLDGRFMSLLIDIIGK